MKNKSIEQTSIHRELLNIYKVFKDFCEKHNLKFFSIQGTTLGAIFWNGLIPWDDDMDIGMPPDDYLKFVELAKTHLPTEFNFIEFPWYGGKLFSKSTTFIEPSYLTRPSLYHGLYIDIVPLIALPDNPRTRKKYNKQIQKYHQKAWQVDHYPTNNNLAELAKLKKAKLKFLHRYKFGKTKFITDFSFGFNYHFLTEGFLNPKMHKFCDTTIPISSTYDYDLRSRYGNYTKYPPEDQRIPHGALSFVDLDKPFSHYQQAFSQTFRNNKWLKKLIEQNNILESNYRVQINRKKRS